MTRISTIHGIPFNEYADRSANVTNTAFFPYLSMTQGELELALLRQRAQIFRQFAPEMPQYAVAIDMIDKALRAGPAGVNYTGVVPDNMQSLAKIIQQAAQRTAPASRMAYMPMQNKQRIGEIIPTQQRYFECLEKQGLSKAKSQNEKNRITRTCQTQLEIERILNGGIEKSGHHLLYKSLPRAYALPNDVSTKRILHQTGVEGMALVGEIPNDLMYLWVENGVLLKNAQQKIGPLGSVKSSLYLAQDPEMAIDTFNEWAQQQSAGTQQKIRDGAAIGKIAIDPVTAGVIIAVAQALVEASKMLTEMRKAKSYAMVQAQGFGTQAYSANQGDWLSQSTGGGAGGNNLLPILLIVGAGLAMTSK